LRAIDRHVGIARNAACNPNAVEFLSRLMRTLMVGSSSLDDAAQGRR
jgi:hypothetical protein